MDMIVVNERHMAKKYYDLDFRKAVKLVRGF
jgi:hypothetical protein